MKMDVAQMVEHLFSMREVQESIPHISILLLGSMYFNFVAFWFTFSFWSYFKNAGKGGCVFCASSFDLWDVAPCEKGAYNSEFVETIGGGDELKDLFY